MTVPSIKEAGDSALLLELEPVIDEGVNAIAIAIAAAVRDDVIPGVRDVVCTYRSVAVYFDPLIADIRDVQASLERAVESPVTTMNGRAFEIPVEYGGQWGPDVADVATIGRISIDAVIARHAERDYRVFMLGFLPGFAYLGPVDPAIAVPRRKSPRERVRAGSVGIAGAQTAVYPVDSPGGWQIIGHTLTRMFDAERWPAALLSPGDSVRFIRQPHGERVEIARGRAGGAEPIPAHRSITVLDPGLMTTVQDGGRWGHQASGVPISGAMDWVAYRTANAIVGNEPGTAALEATLAGPKLRFDQKTIFALAGAELGATLDSVRVPLYTPVSSPAGGVLRFSTRAAGARTYIAADGGVDVPRVLASRSTHMLSHMGGHHGRSLLQGDRLALGAERRAPRRRGFPDAAAYVGRGGARLRVMAGPQHEFFPPEALDVLERTRFVISPQSNRMGYRLQGGPLPRLSGAEMISDAAFTGGIQVPASGEAILLMSDRQTTGGYPQIAVVITADIPLAAQLAPGDWIEFRVCARSDALSALVAQEARLLAFD